MLTESVLIEGVKRTNTVIVCSTQRAGLVQHNLYAMEVDRKETVIAVENLAI